MTELYKKYRPKTLRRIVGCEQTVAALENMLERGTLPHTILFAGPSGCGKTTIARILKTKLNCHDLDWREVDSGSFRGIDSVRVRERLCAAVADSSGLRPRLPGIAASPVRGL